MNPHLQQILHDITVRITKLEEAQQPQRTWLTDEEVLQVRDDLTLDLRTHLDFYRAIEAKLKEKNT